MNILSIIENKDFRRIVQQYTSLNQEEINLKLSSWEKVLNTESFIIPILGIQGAGKSSLLNALLMEDIVLPVDGDETTCIPTEIIYSDVNKDDAEVIFFDGTIKKASCNEVGLKKYVHQEDNPNNIKGVKCIRVYRDSPLLGNGVTFVDLPGVGSLSENNVKTTMDYLENATGAIFLLRTIPPITNSESIFIKMAWPLLSKVFFVQNQWNDETLEEVRDGLEHSKIVLEKIANESKLHKSDVNIDIVNVYQSLTSKLIENSDDLEKSGLINLEDKIIKFIKTWKEDVSVSVKSNIELLLKDSESVLAEELQSVTQNKELLKEEYKKKRIEFDQKFKNSKEKYFEVKEKLEEKKKELSIKINKIIRKSKEDFRNEIRRNLQNGITDGPRLDKVYNDLKNEQIDLIFIETDLLHQDFLSDMQRYLEEIPDFHLKNDMKKAESIEIEENKKWESLLSTIGSAAGGIGGFVGGVKLGAAIGLTGGPGGAAIGAVIGAVVAGVGAFLFSKAGKKAESLVIESRAEEAKKIIFPLIDKWSFEINNNIQTQFSELLKKLFTNVDEFYENAVNNFNLSEQKLVDNINKNDKEKEITTLSLEKDLLDIKRFYNTLKNI